MKRTESIREKNDGTGVAVVTAAKSYESQGGKQECINRIRSRYSHEKTGAIEHFPVYPAFSGSGASISGSPETFPMSSSKLN